MTLRDRVAQIKDGRFSNLAEALDWKDECTDCRYMEPQAKNRYRCAVLGTCPGVTLCDELKEYILKALNPIDSSE